MSNRTGAALWCGAAVIALAIAGGMTGCSTHVLQRPVGRRLRNRLTTLIGPARRYTVRISRTVDRDLVLGRIGLLEVFGEDVRIGGQLPIERLELRLENVRYTGGQMELLSIRRSALTAEFSESALNEYLDRRFHRSRLRAEFTDGAVTLHLVMALLGVPTPIRTTGHLAIADGKRIIFVADRVEAPDAPLLGPGKALVERQLNPLIDMEALGVPVRLTDVRVSDGRAIVEGAADLPADPSQPAKER